MSREYYKITPAVYIILKMDDKILLMLRKNTSYRDGQYSLPSGHIEEGETPTIAAVRETLEEVGIEVDSKVVTHSFTLYRKSERGEGWLDMFLTVRTDKEPVNTEPNKCEKLVWADLNHLPENTFDYLKYVFMKIKSGEVYGEWGYES